MSAMSRYELDIPETAPSPNVYVRAHWRVYHRIKSRWHWLVMEALQPRGKPESALPKARLTITRYGVRMLDPDNLVASQKPVIDALMSAGLILSDGWTDCELHVGQVKDKRKRTFVMIEPLPA